MKPSFRLSGQAGFSLMEILIALTLLGLASAFVATKIFDRLYEGQVQATKVQMGALAGTLKDFKRKCGFYPTTDQGLESLVKKPSGRDCKDYPPSGFLDGELPKDPWNEDYIYESDGNDFNICSNGQDRTQGGEGNDVDICLHEKKAGAAGDTDQQPEAAPAQ